MRTMKTWVAMVMGLFVGLVTEHFAYATVTVASGNAASVNGVVTVNQPSGTCTVNDITAGSKLCVGPGANMFWSQDTNGNLSAGLGLAYTPSATPFTLDSVYVNTIPSVLTYGGGTLPAHAFTIQGIKFYVRTAGSAGSTSATFQVSDGTNTCNCSYACNQSTGGKRATCTNGAGTGCVYAANAVLTYGFTAVGDCAATSADIGGNIDVEGIWQ